MRSLKRLKCWILGTHKVEYSYSIFHILGWEHLHVLGYCEKCQYIKTTEYVIEPGWRGDV